MPRRKSGRKIKDCSKQSTKKYTSRKSPPYPANACCGELRTGNDGLRYVSVANVNGVCRWVKRERHKKQNQENEKSMKKTPKTSPRKTSARKTSSRKAKKRTTSTRKTSPRKTSPRKTSPRNKRKKDWDLYKKLNWDAPTSRT